MNRTVSNLAGTFVFVLFTSSGLSQSVPWPGHVVCSVVINEALGYHHQETQRWDIIGPAQRCTSTTDVDCYPTTWQVQGNGGDSANWWFDTGTGSVEFKLMQLPIGNRVTRPLTSISSLAGEKGGPTPSSANVDEWNILKFGSMTGQPEINLGANTSGTGIIIEKVARPPAYTTSLEVPATCLYSFGPDSPAQQFLSAIPRGGGAFEVFGLDPWDNKMMRRKSLAAHAWGPGNTMQMSWGSTGTGPLGGFAYSPAAAVALSPTTVHVFAIGTDGEAYHISLSGSCVPNCPSPPGIWENIGRCPCRTVHEGRLLGSIAAVSTGNDKIELITIGSDGKAYHKSYAAGTWNPAKTDDWESIGGNVSANLLPSPGVSSWGQDRFDVFATGSDGNLYHKFFEGAWVTSGGAGSKSGEWESVGRPMVARIIGSPSIVSWGSKRIDMFATATDGKVYHKFFAGGWATSGAGSLLGSWEETGGFIAAAKAQSSPAAVSWGPDRLDIFVTGTDGNIHHKFFAGGWAASGAGSRLNSWELIGDSSQPGSQPFTGTPVVISWSANRLDIFAIDGSAKAYHKYFDGFWGPGSRTGNWELISN